ncbi:MAG: class I SAM-dependent methyltransferase [Bacteroidetes bacterium]|nr:class I SAM-dependent methyltransferase [Rhodothermia bacterium]MCS7154454.1 class I SAM-dependent methyltransferase [Bacteroidota bacterium]MCX7906827.1 class I SAM-dependent methyltransferase [Bacteroidota bacterium]MDW8136894.1 class I SAM-dependent methyltransferase [Bacteroidota bacterium]MDW8285236.1 class I SAM-dependent methyltransferase [Bacteroidota bacterium]
MRYEPLKDRLAEWLQRRPWLGGLFYIALELLFLRNWHLRRALRSLRARIPPEQALWVLDAGTGFGLYVRRVLRLWPQARILALDLNERYLRSARRLLERNAARGRALWVVADLSRFALPSACLDLILCVDVLEHIPDDEAALRTMAAMLRPGGRLLISTPSDQGGSGVERPGQEGFIAEHARQGYNLAELCERLRNLGLRIEVARYTYGLPGQWAWRLLIRWPLPHWERPWNWFWLLPYYALALPIGLLLHWFDARLRHERGTGLLVLACSP